MRLAAGEQSPDQRDESPRRVLVSLVLILHGRSAEQRLPARIPTIDGTDEREVHLERGAELSCHPGSAPVPCLDLLPQLIPALTEPLPVPLEICRKPDDVRGYRTGERARGGQGLQRGQLHLINIARSHLDHEQPGTDRLAARNVLAGREDRTARRLGRAQCAVRSQPTPAAAVALRPDQPSRFAL